MLRIQQPEGSSLCGQSCVAMAAGVSLDRAIEAVGHGSLRGTYTREVVAALRSLGVSCADRMRLVKRNLPVLPKRGIVAINQPGIISGRFHWMLTWDGEMLDPAGRWPDYEGWRITSFLEIFS